MIGMTLRQVPGPVGDAARLLIAGDTHGNLDWMRTLSKLAARHGCDGVIQLGDFGFWPDQQELRVNDRLVINDRWLDALAGTAEFHKVWWRVIDGNHDAHPLARAAFPAAENGVRPIRDGVLDWADRGAVWEWCGVRFGALGGAVSIDQEWRTEGLSWWATEEITDSEVDRLIELAGPSGVDVLLTHDAPELPDGISPLANQMKHAACDRSLKQVMRAVDAVDPKILLHGHYHRRYSSVFGTTRIEGLASDEQSSLHGQSWCILELPSLAVVHP
jgi:predicted phosphodiesterase